MGWGLSSNILNNYVIVLKYFHHRRRRRHHNHNHNTINNNNHHHHQYQYQYQYPGGIVEHYNMIITYQRQNQTWFIRCRQDLGIELCYEHLWSISRYGITYLMIFGSYSFWEPPSDSFSLPADHCVALSRRASWKGQRRCGAGGRGPAGDESHRGYPNSWLVFFMENPNLKWMITRGTPMTLLEKPPYEIYKRLYKMERLWWHHHITGANVVPVF